MDRTLHIQLEADPIMEAAVEWFMELRSNTVTGERVAEWQHWLAQDEAHREAFEKVESLWRVSDEIEPVRWPTDAEVAGDSYSGAEGVAAWLAHAAVDSDPALASPNASTRSRRPLRLASWLAAAASVVLVSFLALYDYGTDIAVAVRGGTRLSVETQVGETRTLTLSDGSVISAGGQTSLIVTFLEHTRTVTLKRGEGFFQVAKDRTRPFSVEVGNTAIVAVGTAFDVRRNSDRVVVAVAEGTVRVAGPAGAAKAARTVEEGNVTGGSDRPVKQLEAGQRLTVGYAGSVPQVTAIDSSGVGGWRQGRLQYTNESLATVIADLARYSTRRIVVADPEVAALHVTGVVFDQNVDAWLASLEATFSLRVVRQADGSVRLEQR